MNWHICHYIQKIYEIKWESSIHEDELKCIWMYMKNAQNKIGKKVIYMNMNWNIYKYIQKISEVRWEISSIHEDELKYIRMYKKISRNKMEKVVY